MQPPQYNIIQHGDQTEIRCNICELGPMYNSCFSQATHDAVMNWDQRFNFTGVMNNGHNQMSNDPHNGNVPATSHVVRLNQILMENNLGNECNYFYNR